MDPIALQHIRETLSIAGCTVGIVVGVTLMASVALWVLAAWSSLR